jgi:Holliday junction DNA helicase RuvA
MFSHFKGTLTRLRNGEASVDVEGVGYRVTMPIDAWEQVKDGDERTLYVSTYVREDRLELFGFLTVSDRELFEELLKRQGIGPKIALELCACPRELLAHAITEKKVAVLTSIKGIGKKTAEKLLLELESLMESRSELFQTRGAAGGMPTLDQDALSALSTLGYDTSTILRVLKELPKDLVSTEERVAAALRLL